MTDPMLATEDEFWDHVTKAVLGRARREIEDSMGVKEADPMLAKAVAREAELLSRAADPADAG